MKRVAIILTTILAFIVSSAVAQSNAPSLAGAIYGNVIDENGKALAYATVNLKKSKDSSLVKTTISDSTGIYIFKNVLSGNYFLSVSMTGYLQIESKSFFVSEINPGLQLDVSKLYNSNKALQNVTVTSKRSFIERKIDRTVLNIESNAIAAGSTVMEVLEKAPGVLVDKDGNITMAGKSGVMVMIDGKQTYMSAGDLAQFLKTMQSSQLEAIELITNPSAKYDAAGNSGIINIKTKKVKTVGTNGSLTAGAGYSNDYKTNAGISLNHRSRNVNVFGSYFNGNNNNGRKLNIERTTLLDGQNTFFKQGQVDDRNWKNNNFKAGADYFINSKNTIGVLFNGYANKGTNKTNNVTYIGSNEKTYDSVIMVAGDNESFYNNAAFNLNYKTTLDSAGQELSVDVDYAYNKFNNTTTYNNTFFTGNGSILKAPHIYKNTSPASITIKSVKADYVYPVSKATKLEAGWKSSVVHTDNDLKFDDYDGNEWKNNALRSNQFNYAETIHAAYVNANRKFSKTTAQLGLRAENTISKGVSITEHKTVKRSYLNLFPSLFINHALNDNNTLSFSYSRRIDRPDYDALNPFVFYLDEYTFQKGNPFLNPQYSHALELTYQFKKKYSATFGYTNTRDIITEVILPDTARKALYQTSANLNNANFYSLNINAPFTITKWWNTNNSFTAFTNQYNAHELQGLNLSANKTSFYFSSSHNFTIANGFSAEVSGNYRSSMVYGTLFMGSEYGMDLGMNKSILNKKGSLKFSVADALDTRKQKIHSTLSGVSYNLVQKPDTRVVRLTFNYRFGSNNIKEARNRSTGLDSEQRRIKK